MTTNSVSQSDAPHERNHSGVAIAVHAAPHEAAEGLDAYEWLQDCKRLIADACVLTTRCSKAARSIPTRLAIPSDRLQHVSSFFELIDMIRGKTKPIKAIVRMGVRFVGRKLLGTLGRRVGAVIGAMFSPPGAVIIGAAIGIWIGCTLAHILSAAI